MSCARCGIVAIGTGSLVKWLRWQSKRAWRGLPLPDACQQLIRRGTQKPLARHKLAYPLEAVSKVWSQRFIWYMKQAATSHVIETHGRLPKTNTWMSSTNYSLVRGACLFYFDVQMCQKSHFITLACRTLRRPAWPDGKRWCDWPRRVGYWLQVEMVCRLPFVTTKGLHFTVSEVNQQVNIYGHLRWQKQSCIGKKVLCKKRYPGRAHAYIQNICEQTLLSLMDF